MYFGFISLGTEYSTCTSKSKFFWLVKTIFENNKLNSHLPYQNCWEGDVKIIIPTMRAIMEIVSNTFSEVTTTSQVPVDYT